MDQPADAADADDRHAGSAVVEAVRRSSGRVPEADDNSAAGHRDGRAVDVEQVIVISAADGAVEDRCAVEERGESRDLFALASAIGR